MSQVQDMVEEDLVGGVKQKVQTVEMMVPKTIPAASGRDGPKVGMLRNHCEKVAEEGTVKVAEEGTVNEKAGEGVFKMPKIPRKTPEKKGKGKGTEIGVQGDGEGDSKGKKVGELRVCFLLIIS